MSGRKRELNFIIDENSLDIAYLLGVYLTDGSIYKGAFRLNSIDLDFMERVADILYRLIGLRPNIREIARRSKKHSQAWEMAITCHELCDWLLEKTNKKMNVPQFVFQQSLDWQKEFLAGVMDGDGFISIQHERPNKTTGHIVKNVKIGFCGLKNSYMLDMRSLLDKMGIRYSYTDKIKGPDLQEMRYYDIRALQFVEHGLYFKIERKVRKTIIMKNEKIGLQARSETKSANTQRV